MCESCVLVSMYTIWENDLPCSFHKCSSNHFAFWLDYSNRFSITFLRSLPALLLFSPLSSKAIFLNHKCHYISCIYTYESSLP